jgi:NitT/TauT family transport system permease protein
MLGSGMRQLLNKARPLLIVLLALFAAEFAIRFFTVPQYLAPAPSVVLADFLANWRSLFTHLTETMTIALLGTFTGGLVALALSLIMARFQGIKSVMLPLLIGLQAIPVVAVAPFFMIWFGAGLPSKLALTFLIVYFPAVFFITGALSSRHRELEMLFQVAGASRTRIFREVYVPLAFPAFVSGMEVTASLGMIGAIVAELSGSGSGIGFVVLSASYNFNTPRMFSALALAAIASYLIVLCIGSAARQVSEHFGLAQQQD